MTPWCHNRPPAPAGAWMRAGRAPCGRERWRWVRYAFADVCASWLPGPGQPPEPIRQGWNCGGCRWLPAEVAA